MTNDLNTVQTRRALMKSALVMASGAVVSACATRTINMATAPAAHVPVPAGIPAAPEVAKAFKAPGNVRPELFRRALAALDRHSARVDSHDRIAIADFATPSHRPRFHIVNLGTGETQSFLVAHGIGSDPEHTGLLHRFSNEVNSEATSEGAFVTSDYYVGKHGQSQRLIGLDATNNNALDRAIVVHAAWYSNPDMIATHGKLGRSQGCFAVGEGDLSRVFEALGPGRMIYSAKV